MRGLVVIVDDEREMCDLLSEGLTRSGFRPICFTDARGAFEATMREPVDAVLADLRMPGMDGISLCERVRTNRPEIPVIVITAFGCLDGAVSAIRAGAYDFVSKPIEIESLTLVLDRAVRHRRLQHEVRVLRQALASTRRFEGLIGESAPMKRLFDILGRLSGVGATVLLTGESGTGKELAARALHKEGPRAGGPFVAVNCAAMPAGLLESELFGYAQGAFTDARRARKGLFQEAEGGTLFLDEIAELPLNLQPKLLRALEEKRVRSLGSNRELTCDVRVVAATNRDLEEAVSRGAFREDLFFRLSVLQVELPPLRSRGRDIVLLAQHFLEDLAHRNGAQPPRMSPSFLSKILDYEWPGNVRELRNAMERAMALRCLDVLVVEDLPERIRRYDARRITFEAPDSSDLVALEELERRYIRHVLRATRGNRTAAARILGLDRKTLYRKLRNPGGGAAAEGTS